MGTRVAEERMQTKIREDGLLSPSRGHAPCSSQNKVVGTVGKCDQELELACA